jgi:hypothetical protein
MTTTSTSRADAAHDGRRVASRDFRLLWSGQAASTLGTSVRGR